MTGYVEIFSRLRPIKSANLKSTCCALLVALALAPLPVYAQVVRAPNPYGRDVEFTVALRERQTIIGELPLRISKDGVLSVNTNALATALGNRITPDAALALLGSEASEGQSNLEALGRIGYQLSFNDAELELSIIIPLSAKPRLDYSVMGPAREELGDFDEVAPFSFAANLRVTGDYSHSAFGENLSGSGTLNLLGRMGKIAYQSGYRISGQGQGLLHEGSRFVLDDLKHALRWQLGDIRPFSASPLGGDDILGFGVSREANILQPDHIARLRGAQTFSIQEPSEVTVSVNGRVVTRRNFAPGNYNIADFPFVLGRNQIDLQILNQSGEQQSLSFNQFLDSRLLESGSDDFGIAFGIESRSGYSKSRSYDASKWTLNAHYIRGVSEKLTLGIATVLSDQHRAILATGVQAGPLGITSGRFGLDYSDSGSRTATLGFGLVRALNSRIGGRQSRSFRMGFDSRIDLNETRNSRTSASLGYAWPLNRRLTVSADLRLSEKSRSASFQTSFGLTNDLRLDLSVDWRSNRESRTSGPGISISLSRSLGTNGQARGSYDSWLGESRLSVSHTPNSGLNLWSNSADLTTTNKATSLLAAQSALFNRLEVATSASANWGERSSSQRLGLSAGTALAFANGRFGWGRPVNDSFAIISGHRSLEGRAISIDSRGPQSGPIAKTGLFGPALISGLGTYSARLLSVTLNDPPIGYDIGSGTYRISPPLYGGYSFVIGSETSATAIGILVLSDGKPAALIAGIATSADWPKVAPITVFTNANGQFNASGLGAGRWSLKMRGIEGSFDFYLDTNQGSFVDIGSIRVGDMK